MIGFWVKRGPLAVAAVLLSLSAVTADVRADTDRLMRRLKSALEDAVCARNGFDREDVEIVLHRIRIPDRYDGATELRIEIPEYDDAIGPITARAYFKSKGKRLGSMPIPARVRVYDDVLVTTCRLGRHDVIDTANLESRRLEITKLVKWAMSDPDSVIGRWATRTINPGRIVDRRWLADVPLIQRGDRVVMSYSHGAVRVTSNVIAMEDGYNGQQIMVKSEQAKRLLPAVIVDQNTVTPAR